MTFTETRTEFMEIPDGEEPDDTKENWCMLNELMVESSAEDANKDSKSDDNDNDDDNIDDQNMIGERRRTK